MNGTSRIRPAAKTGQGHGPLYIRGQVSRFVPVRVPEGESCSAPTHGPFPGSTFHHAHYNTNQTNR